MLDLIIVGGGPAGMTAAIYAARKQLDMVMISPDVGGQATWATDVENYLGYRFITGFELVLKFEEHVRDFGVQRIDDTVTSCRKEGQTFVVETKGGGTYESRAVLAASGRSARNLGVPGEEEFKGRGVTYCATCDAPLFNGEDVAVVGGGNAGLDAAIQLIKIARRISLVEYEPRLTGDKALQDRVYSAPNARVLTHTEVVSLTGHQMLEGMTVRDLETCKTEHLPVSGVFIEIGSMPKIDYLPSDVDVTVHKEIKVDCANHTSVTGLFAAGDATNIPGKQIIIAAGEGSKALLSAYDYILHTFPGDITEVRTTW